MKKLLSLFVPLMALFLTLAPQTARAQVNEYLSFYCSWASSTVTPTAVGTPDVNLEYSTDKANWTPVTMGTAIDIHTAKVYFRGNNPTGFSKSKSDYVWFNISVSTNTCTVAGNVMSLVNGNDFATNYSTIPNDYCFYRLFSSGAKVSYNYINASAMTLPADNLTTGCYQEMFFYTGIKNLPKLPAQNLADSCYYSMFYRCLNIETMTTDGVNYVLPAEELAPHCYEYMFGFYNESLSTTFRCEIMATSCQDRTGNDIAKCLASMFNFQVNNTKSWNVYLYIYFKTLGNTSSATCPTYDWFWGTKNTGRNYIYHDSGINSTSKRNSSNNSPYGAFPYGSYLYSTTYTYLTFNCAANDGTWEEGSAYNTDLRRVVRANYTAKTIPAPPVKDGARFLGWFTSASGDGEMLTEEQLKQITTATTVYARFVDNNKYTLFVNPSDKATITVTDNSSNSYTPGTLYILDSNDKTFTLSCTGVTSGYSFYRWIGGQVDGNTVMFREGQKDLVITGVITPASGFDNASGTVYLSGSGAGTSNKVPLPSEAVDLGAAGIWAKYNVDKTTANGFASSETATGSYFAWGMTDIGSGYAGATSMSDGENLPVTVETDAAYKFCGNKWRIATKDEWATLLNNSTLTYVNTYDAKFTANGNSITLGHNGYQNNTGTNYFNTVIKYWTSTYYGLASSTQTAYAFAGTYNSGRYNPPTRSPILNYYTDENYSDGYNYIQYGYAIRPILNVNKRTLTIHALHLDEDDNPVTRDYIYECDLNQNITVTATADEQGFIFDHWEDSDGNLYSEDNPLTFRVYDNLEFTAVFEFGTLIEHHVTFYDEDGITVLYEDDFREGKKPVYRGSTPTKAGGYVFNGWSPAITKLGESDATYTATYLKTYTITTSAAHGTVELTPASPTDQVSEGVYKTGTSLTMTVTADPGYVFTQWSDGNTQNPRTVSVTADASYTAEFRIESLPVSVDAYQSAPADVKQILYLLAPQTGNDSKIYRPVDMGNGLAWANKNVGANDSIDNGSFFYWGGTTAVTTAATSAYYTGLTSMSTTASYDATQYPLPAAADAATVNMGERWRMPTLAEIYYLTEETGCTESGAAASGFFYTNNDDGKKIFIPSAGCYKSTTRTTGVTLFWGSTVSYKSTYQSRPAYYLSGVSNAGTTSYYAYYALPVRAVYVPAYTPVTLTINAGERQYIYYCQPGQQVTVTAHPNTAASYLFDEWEDNHSTNPERTFTVTESVTYTAKMKDNPEAASYSVTFQDWDGTTLQAAYSLIDGRVPVYSGAALKRKGYLFKGWTDANDVFTASDAALPAVTGDVVYTATYVKNPCLTITNTHVSASTTVSMKKNSSATNRTFYIKILDADGTVTTDWTQKIVNSTSGVTFGNIPAGGSMLIRGSNTAISTSNSYYLYFVISGGSPEVSGNILSLVACTDGETVGSHTVTTYDFSRLFLNCSALTSAEDLELPSTTLNTYCYYCMFSGCTNLKKAPKVLPAAALPQYCYGYMFKNCTALEDAPDIQATSITGTYACANMFEGCTSLVNVQEELHAPSMTSNCYYQMFYNCSSLTTAPALPATTLATYCYRYMFNGCTSLTTGPGTLPALALPQYCYAQMFYGCTSLTTAPEIEATSASSTYACQQMFYGCTSLTKAPSKLKITGTAQQYVYNGMFQNCSSLETAPDILATSQANYGWQNMFSGCSKLKKIRTYATTLAGTSNYKTSSWVASVPQTGDFYCPPTLARSYDANHIPLSTTYKWKVYSYNVTFVPVEGCTWNDASVSNKQFTWETDVDNVTDFIGNESLAGAIFYTDAACTTEISVADITAALATQKESSAATTKNYYVKKAPSTHTLTWNVSGGNELEGDYTHGDVDSGTGIIVPANPTRAGFEFAGWDAGNDGIADEVATIMPAFDLTYTAIWRQIFTVTFKDAENNTLQSGGVAEGSVPVFSGDIPVKASADPDHVWNFTGWTDGNDNFVAKEASFPSVTGTTTYTATYLYDLNYLTLTNTSNTDGYVYLDRRLTGNYSTNNLNVAYSINGGEWTEEITYGTSAHDGLSISLPAGQSVRFRGYNLKNDTWQCGKSNSIYFGFNFPTSGTTFMVSGDLMTLVAYKDGELHTGEYPMGDYCFRQLFKDCNKLTDASGLKLSATTLSDYCYQAMFSGCTALTSAPQISATSLAQYCCASMFSGCSALTTAPALPVTTLAPYCYQYMFSGCTHLTAAPQLPATTLTEGCYQYMFQGCTMLTDVPEALPGTNLPANCYGYMFSGCSALTTAPEIMAAADAVPGMGACDNMFASCTSLTKAPSRLLPETVNNNLTYSHMFYNCPLLTEGPDIHATTISNGGTKLQYMFSTASNLRKIRVYFPAWGSMTFCSYWTNSVAATGDFYCPPALERRYNNNEQTPSYIPTGWTVYSYDVTFVPVGGKWADGTATEKQFTWRTDKSDIDDFIAAQVDEDQNSLIQGWFLNAACTEATSEAEVKADLSVQQTAETKRIYVRLNGTNPTLLWDFNGGTTTSTEAEYTFGVMEAGDPITAPAAPTRFGYAFMGWSSAQPADNTPVTVATVMPATDLIYTAIWQVLPIYLITANTGIMGTATLTADNYDDAEGSGSYIAGTQVTISVTPYFGYTFTGWSDSNTDNPRTVTVGNTAATYTAQFDAMDEIDITMTEGTLDFPTYAKNSFAIIGENGQVEVRLHFGAAISTGNHLANLSTDLANSYIQPAGESKRQIASATVATVTYAGELFRAAHLVAKVTDTDGRKYNIDIYTNYCINYATFEEDYTYTYYKTTLPLESSWVTGRSFVYGEDNHFESVGIPSLVHTNVLRVWSQDYDGNTYHSWLQFNPLTTGEGQIPTGIYPINSTGAPGTAYVGSIPSGFSYNQYGRGTTTPAYHTNTGSWVYQGKQDPSTYVITYDNWALRGGYVEVVNVDETYYVHVHAYTDGYKTLGEQSNTVIDFTAGGATATTLNPVAVTISAQTTGGEALTDAVTATLAGASNWTDVEIGQGSHTFFSGNTLNLTAAKPGYLFDHWEVNGVPVAGEDFTYSYTVGSSETNIVAVFTVDTRPFYTITVETGGRGTVTLTADGYKPQTGSGYYADNTSVTMSVTANTGSTFLRWSDGNTSNPRIVTVTENKTYTAEFSLESADQAVNVYQAAAADTMKILYNLDAKTGLDGNTYIPVDLGYGVAWADRNVGATNPNTVGTYFYWGDTEGHTSFNAYQALNTSSYTSGTTLTPDLDAATQQIGTAWRMPTDEEWLDLRKNTTQSADHGTFMNKTYAGNTIYLPASGFYGTTYGNLYLYGDEGPWTSKLFTNYRFYWSSVYFVQNASNGLAFPYTFEDAEADANNYYYVNTNVTLNSTSYGFFDCFGMPVRAIYEPEYPTYTLTINVGTKQYKYICQAGQNITVTANATVEGYVFDKWTEDDNTNATRTFNVTGNMSFTATFKEAPSTPVYDITIETDGTGYGTVDVSAVNDVEEGTAITVSDNTLTINGTTVTATPAADTEAYKYKFTGWTDNEGNTLPATITEDLTVRANFAREMHLVLCENCENEHYNDFLSFDGMTANTVTLNRQFTAGRWSTLCLPFDVNKGMFTSLNFGSRIYEFKYATGNADEGVNLYFSIAKSIEAGKGYIVNADAKLATRTSFVFPGVKIDLSADNGAELNSVTAYDNLKNGCSTQGNIELVGTLRKGTLKGTTDGNTYMGLKENKIYYPNIATGSTILAYRGIFRSIKGTLNAERIRIIVDGEDMGELRIDKGEMLIDNSAEPRKFIENGVLYIERNGVIYDATGKRVELDK